MKVATIFYIRVHFLASCGVFRTVGTQDILVYVVSHSFEIYMLDILSYFLSDLQSQWFKTLPRHQAMHQVLRLFLNFPVAGPGCRGFGLT